MSHSSSYDEAFRLSHILENHKKRFCEDNNITIYPSSWFDGYFEITIRNRENSREHYPVDMSELKGVILNYISDNWTLSSEDVQEVDDVAGTPIKLKFQYRE